MAKDRYVHGFWDGQVVAYCEMVCRGVRLAGQLDVPLEVSDGLALLAEREGCMARVVARDPDRAAVWIYRDKAVNGLIDALSETPMPTEVGIWGMGKLLGYGDRDVLDFFESRSVFVGEPIRRPCLDRQGFDTA